MSVPPTTLTPLQRRHKRAAINRFLDVEAEVNEDEDEEEDEEEYGRGSYISLYPEQLFLTWTQSQTSSSPSPKARVMTKRVLGDQSTMPDWTDATESSTTRTWHG